MYVDTFCYQNLVFFNPYKPLVPKDHLIIFLLKIFKNYKNNGTQNLDDVKNPKFRIKIEPQFDFDVIEFENFSKQYFDSMDLFSTLNFCQHKATPIF